MGRKSYSEMCNMLIDCRRAVAEVKGLVWALADDGYGENVINDAIETVYRSPALSGCTFTLSLAIAHSFNAIGPIKMYNILDRAIPALAQAACRVDQAGSQVRKSLTLPDDSFGQISLALLFHDS